MSLAADHLDLAPPPPQGLLRALWLAVLAHVLLMGALTWGVHWQSKPIEQTFEAELWSSLPQIAAPKLQEAAPPSQQAAVKETLTPVQSPEIITEKVKPNTQEKPPPKADIKPVAKPTPNPAEQQRKQAEAQDKAREAERQKNLERIAGLAGATGAASATGTAQNSSGMAAGWDDKVKARVNPLINYSGDRTSLKELDLSIKLLPDGSIAERPRILKSSGSPQWDEAVVRAFEKAQTLPRDANGKLPPSPFLLTWKARE